MYPIYGFMAVGAGASENTSHGKKRSRPKQSDFGRYIYIFFFFWKKKTLRGTHRSSVFKNVIHIERFRNSVTFECIFLYQIFRKRITVRKTSVLSAFIRDEPNENEQTLRTAKSKRRRHWEIVFVRVYFRAAFLKVFHSCNIFLWPLLSRNPYRTNVLISH